MVNLAHAWRAAGMGDIPEAILRKVAETSLYVPRANETRPMADVIAGGLDWASSSHQGSLPFLERTGHGTYMLFDVRKGAQAARLEIAQTWQLVAQVVAPPNAGSNSPHVPDYALASRFAELALSASQLDVSRQAFLVAAEDPDPAHRGAAWLRLSDVERARGHRDDCGRWLAKAAVCGDRQVEALARHKSRSIGIDLPTPQGASAHHRRPQPVAAQAAPRRAI